MLPQKRSQPDSGPRPPKLTEQEHKIYELIKAKENMGMWVADIKKGLGIQSNALNKLLKGLIAKGLIKNVVNIRNKSHKTYMAVEFEPSKEVSGGMWYNDSGEYDHELVRILRQLCMSFIRKLKVATTRMVLDEIKKSGVVKTDMSLEQVSDLLGTMVLDKEIDRLRSTGMGDFAHVRAGETCYRLPGGKEGPKAGVFASIPCGVCPRISECTPGGVISPQNCEYYDKWLGIDF